MKKRVAVFGVFTAILFVSGVAYADSSDIDTVMCEQFSIQGASKDVIPVGELDRVFATAHHAPRNIPIDVALPGDGVAYIHFPIVEAGRYLVFSTDPARLAGVKLKSGEAVDTSTLAAPRPCADILTGGLAVDLSDDKVAGPTPIAIEFGAGPTEDVRLIISRDPIN